MFFHCHNGRLRLENAHMDYIRFGTGGRVLILLPGLGDGLTTVKGTALPMALTYRQFARDFTVYMFSRREPLAPGSTTRDMARDLKEAMELLNIGRADILGVSMGGMIAQHLAADYPELVNRLVLAVTACCPNPALTEAVTLWMELARSGNHTALMDSNVRAIYSDSYYRKNKWMIPIVGRLTNPASYDRFLIQAQACLTHDSRESLGGICIPTLILAGGQDKVVGPGAAGELSRSLPHAQVKIWEQWGHGVYEEETAFNQTVFSWLTKED